MSGAHSPIRVVLADDHAILRAGLRALLETKDDLVVVGEAKTAAEAEEVASACCPDVLILDISMPGGGTMEALERIAHGPSETGVLVLTMHDDESYLRACLAAGAAGYLVKSAADDEAEMAFRAVHAGRSYIGITRHRTKLAQVVGQPRPGLSRREQQVLELVAFGNTNAEIGTKLGVGVKSIESYRARLYEKLRFRCRRDLVRYAVSTGILRAEQAAADELEEA